MSTENVNVIDVTEADFDEKVIAASREKPVVVDFWAPWCGPCRILGPALEKVVNSYGGAVLLAKLNTDENQGLARRYNIQGIPAIKVFRDGEVVEELVGAQPEEELRRMLDRAAPSDVDAMLQTGDRLIKGGQIEDGVAEYDRALAADPQHQGALLRMAMVALQSGDADRARELASSVRAGAPEYDAAQAILAKAEFRGQSANKDPEELARTVAENENDLDARFDLAMHQADHDLYEDALENLALIVEADKSFRDGAAKDAMVRIFGIIGQSSELAGRFRQRLASALY